MKKIIKAIETDFGYVSMISSNGDFGKIKGKERILNMLFNLLTIKEGSYPFDKDLGTTLHKYIYENYLLTNPYDLSKK